MASKYAGYHVLWTGSLLEVYFVFHIKLFWTPASERFQCPEELIKNNILFCEPVYQSCLLAGEAKLNMRHVYVHATWLPC